MRRLSVAPLENLALRDHRFEALLAFMGQQEYRAGIQYLVDLGDDYLHYFGWPNRGRDVAAEAKQRLGDSAAVACSNFAVTGPTREMAG